VLILEDQADVDLIRTELDHAAMKGSCVALTRANSSLMRCAVSPDVDRDRPARVQYAHDHRSGARTVSTPVIVVIGTLTPRRLWPGAGRRGGCRAESRFALLPAPLRQRGKVQFAALDLSPPVPVLRFVAEAVHRNDCQKLR
jgi:hypothetical protein